MGNVYLINVWGCVEIFSPLLLLGSEKRDTNIPNLYAQCRSRMTGSTWCKPNYYVPVSVFTIASSPGSMLFARPAAISFSEEVKIELKVLFLRRGAEHINA